MFWTPPKLPENDKDSLAVMDMAIWWDKRRLS